MTDKMKQKQSEDIEKRLPEYSRDAMANLTDEDLKTLLRHVTREVALRAAAKMKDEPNRVAVMVHGPNLRDQSKGQFHVHTIECKDNAKEIRNNGSEYPMKIEVESRLDVVEDVYHDQLNEQPDDDNGPNREATKRSWLDGEFHFAPCCKSLPTEVK